MSRTGGGFESAAPTQLSMILYRQFVELQTKSEKLSVYLATTHGGNAMPVVLTQQSRTFLGHGRHAKSRG